MRLFLLLLCCAMTCQASALTLRLCTFDHSFRPFTMPDGSGHVQELLRRAASEQGIAIVNSTAPRQRCMAQLQHGDVDAVVAGFVPERLAFGVYPMQAGQPDQSRVLAVARFMVYRRSGSAAEWDGRLFSGLGQQAVGVQFGFIHINQLKQLGVPVDDGANSADSNMAKLVHKRLAAMIALEDEARLLSANKYQGQVEALPQPFQTTPLYLLINRKLYEASKEQVEQLWQALRKHRQSPEYQQYLSQPLPPAPTAPPTPASGSR